jgi:quercetin dioxygenase-like cupin family protein
MMPFIPSTAAAVFNLHGAAFTALASPSRGATENAVWVVEIGGNTPGVAHRVTREETLVGLEGRVFARVDEETFELTAGSALIVPANAELQVSNPDPLPFRAVVVLPVGGQAVIAGQKPFTPPWAV